MGKIKARAFQRWNQSIADMAALKNRDRVPELLIRACDALLSSDAGLVAIYGDSIKPVLLFDDVPENIRPQHVDDYMGGAYLLDPYYRAGIDRIESGLYRLRDVAPPGFRQSEYYRRNYKASLIIDEVGFITHLPDGCFANASFVMLDGSQRFKKAESDNLRLVQSVVDQVLINHWAQHRSAQDEAGSELHSQLEVALGMFGDSVLTEREAEVVRLYLHGHSTNSITERLKISTHTVSMHRKNAYLKLDIKSQFELFHLFIDSLSCFDPKTQRDPLRGYLGIN